MSAETRPKQNLTPSQLCIHLYKYGSCNSTSFASKTSFFSKCHLIRKGGKDLITAVKTALFLKVSWVD